MKRKLQMGFVLGLCILNTNLFSQWTQVGVDILGENEGGTAGYSVGINSNGTVIASGDRNAILNGVDGAGEGRVYSLEDGVWTLKGDPIQGSSEYGWCGHDVALDASGDVLAISSINTYNANQNSVGSVRVFEWDGMAWVQRGDLIEGDENVLGFATFYGYSIDLSADGNSLVIGGSEKWSTQGDLGDIGYVQVFDWDGINWIQRGEDIFGEVQSMRLGKSVSISTDGQTIACAAPRLGSLFSEVGVVRIYGWDGNEWIQNGQDILGSLEGDDLGEGLSLANNGLTVAVGAPGYVIGTENMTGDARVYDFDGDTWVQRGADLVSIEQIDNFGIALSLSEDGNRLVVSASNLTNNALLAGSAGAAVVYEWDGTEWMEISAPILGEQTMEFARAVEISTDGLNFAFGSFGYDPAGRVRVYRDPLAANLSEQSKFNLSLYPNPAQEYIFLECDAEMHGEVLRIYDAYGKIVKRELVNNERMSISLESLSQGIYIIQLGDESNAGMRFVHY